MANPFFVVTIYSAETGNRPLPVIPQYCPKHLLEAGECKVVIHFWRERKTGLLRFLAVAKCNEHNKAFTLYPPGMLPFKRQALVVNIDIDGKVVNAEDIETLTKETLFEAAYDKSIGEEWPKEQPADSPVTSKRFDTGSRHIRQSAQLLALNPDMTSNVNQAITEVLDLNPLMVSEQRQLIGSSSTDKCRSLAISSILKELSWSETLFERLVAAGNIAELWPKMYRVNPHNKYLHLNPFHKFSSGKPISGFT